MIPVNPHIAAMAPYALVDFGPAGAQPLISMAQNESLRPPSPRAVAAGHRVLSSAELYPDPDWAELRAAIADVHKVSSQYILCGAGSMELIGALAQAYAGPGARVLSSQYGYAFFSSVARQMQAPCDIAPEEGQTVSVDNLLATAQPETRLVFVANPGNPSGTLISNSELRKLRAGLSDSILLVIDEAYGEFADGLETPLFDLVSAGNTVILRTFSKAYGLAGARVGWGVFPPDVAQQMRKVLNPNNVSTVSQAAATAAMLDQPYMIETCAITARLRDEFLRQLRRIDLIASDSFTNFVLIQFDTAKAASSADQALRDQGILMRNMAGYGLAHCLRATISNREHMNLAVEVLQDWSEGKESQ